MSIKTVGSEEKVFQKKRPIVAPGEMEQIRLDREKLLAYAELQALTIKIEEA